MQTAKPDPVSHDEEIYDFRASLFEGARRCRLLGKFDPSKDNKT